LVDRGSNPGKDSDETTSIAALGPT